MDAQARRGLIAMRRHAAWAVIALVFVFSLWLRRGFPILGLGSAGHDDLLFVQLAAHLQAFDWLGPYNHMTLAKGAAYSMFIALNQPTGLSLKTSEHIVYLLACLLFAATAGKLFRSRAAALVVFVVLALNPTAWAADVGGRVVREGLYTPLTLLLLALGTRVFVPDAASASAKARLGWAVALGVTGAIFWLTREEGAWLAPALLILVTYRVLLTWREARPRAERLRAVGRHLAIPLAGFLAVVGAVNAMNFLHYGVFRNNDFRSSDFQGAYGALSRISHDHWRRHIVFPADARARAFSVSPAATELKPFLDGELGRNYVKVSCEQTGGRYCDEIHSGWFMWALRDAAFLGGHYGSAPMSRAFYRRLAREINDACDRNAIPCGPRRSTMIPPWHPSYLRATLVAAHEVFVTLAHVGRMSVWTGETIGSGEQIALFARMTNGPLSTAQYQGARDSRRAIATAIASIQKGATAILLPASLALWAVLLVVAAVRRHWHPAHVLVAAMAAAIGMRVALLAFLDATSIPANNTLYLSPAIPVALALAPCVAFLLLDYGRAWLRRAPRSAPRSRSAS